MKDRRYNQNKGCVWCEVCDELTAKLNNLTRQIGGTEESVMGQKSSWTIEWAQLNGQILTQHVQAHNIVDAVSAFECLPNHGTGYTDRRNILSARRD